MLAVIALTPALILLFVHLPRIFFPKEKKKMIFLAQKTFSPLSDRYLRRWSKKEVQRETWNAASVSFSRLLGALFSRDFIPQPHDVMTEFFDRRQGKLAGGWFGAFLFDIED